MLFLLASSINIEKDQYIKAVIAFIIPTPCMRSVSLFKKLY